MRLFTAVNFDEDIKKALLSVQQRLKLSAASGNFTRSENLHLTLVFLGEVLPNCVPIIRTAISNVKFDPFEIAFTHTGSFNRGGKDIFWIGAEKNQTLSRVQSRLYDELLRARFELERRAFVPHLTLAREVVLGAPFIEERFRITASVSKISLMSSERINGRLTYTEI